MRAKINQFLGINPIGTDDTLAFVNLRKADLTLLLSLFGAGLDDVLTDPGTFFLVVVFNLE